MANTLKFGNGEWYGKKDTILAYNDENSNYKPLPFDFSRASSATVINKDGLIETVGSGQPRIDYKDDSKGALLLEPSRTNILVQSNQFDTTWSATNLTVTSGQTGVGGSVDAWKLNLTGVNSRVQYNISTSGQKSFSIYAKAGTLDFIRLFAAGGDNPSVFFNLSNGTVSSQDVEVNSANIKNIGNGWYRCEMVYNETISSVRIYPAIADGDISQTSGDIYIQYAQLEQGSYATSYIPTQGSAVTRLADSCTNENLNVDYSGDYTLYLEHETLSLTEYNQFQFRQETPISYIFRVGNSINIGSGLYSTANTIGFNKFALSVTSIGSYKFYKNGFLLSSGSGLNANLETLTTGGLGMSIKEIKLYNTALTDQELIALTS